MVRLRVIFRESELGLEVRQDAVPGERLVGKPGDHAMWAWRTLEVDGHSRAQFPAESRALTLNVQLLLGLRNTILFDVPATCPCQSCPFTEMSKRGLGSLSSQDQAR